jgi:hypothetical protein
VGSTNLGYVMRPVELPPDPTSAFPRILLTLQVHATRAPRLGRHVLRLIPKASPHGVQAIHRALRSTLQPDHLARSSDPVRPQDPSML